jgi:hypothetical protein
MKQLAAIWYGNLVADQLLDAGEATSYLEFRQFCGVKRVAAIFRGAPL